MKEVIKLDRKQKLKQSNNLVMARYNLGLYEQRMIIAICSQLKDDDTSFSAVRVKVADLADFCQIVGHDKYKRVHRTLLSLMAHTIEIQQPNGEWYATHWLQSAQYLGNGLVEYCLDPGLQAELLQIKSTYINTPAAPLMEFKRDYTARIYFLLKQKMRLRGFDYELEFLRDRLQLGETYNRLSNIKAKVLEPALAEINKKSDIKVQHKYVKQGRSYTRVHFIVTPKPKEERMPNLKPAQVDIVQKYLRTQNLMQPELTSKPASPSSDSLTLKNASKSHGEPLEHVANPSVVLLPTPEQKTPSTTSTDVYDDIAPKPASPSSDRPTLKNASESSLEPLEHVANPSVVLLPTPEQKTPSTTSTDVYDDIASKPASPSTDTTTDSQHTLMQLLTNPTRWGLAEPIAQRLVKRYGVARVQANLSYAEQNSSIDYTDGSWLIHCIVTNKAQIQAKAQESS